MHPYLMEQQIKARNENLHRELARPRPERRGTRPRPSLRHDLGWMLVGLGLRMVLGRSALRGGPGARRGNGPAVTHG